MVPVEAVVPRDPRWLKKLAAVYAMFAMLTACVAAAPQAVGQGGLHLWSLASTPQ